MFTYRDFVLAFDELGLTKSSRILVHSNLDAEGEIEGGTEAVLGALLASCEMVLTPAFTHSSIVVPAVGPSENAIEYGASDIENLEAEFFHPEMLVDEDLGVLPGTMLKHEAAGRSSHPVLSFAGIHAAEPLAFQTLTEPFGPISWLAEYDGDILFINAEHTSNISLHYAEQLAGRQALTRWALTEDGVVECRNMPGCSQGFEAIRPRLTGEVQQISIGPIKIELIPVRDLLHIAAGWLREDPRALLCGTPDCLYCPQVRASIRKNV
jgi:aminoglycoside 3-N-acetyltransferase